MFTVIIFPVKPENKDYPFYKSPKKVLEIEDDENGLSEVFDVIEETNDEEERYEKLEKVWEKLKEVDRMILVGYYVDGNNMEEIAKKVGYKNGDSVKSRKKKFILI